MTDLIDPNDVRQHPNHQEDQRDEEIPADWPVQPLAADINIPGRTTCGRCGRSWDDSVSTGMTPTPSGRCPFEGFHRSDDLFDYDSLDDFTKAYVECALWSSMDNSTEVGGEPMDKNYGPEDIHPATLAIMILDCKKFQDENRDLIVGKYIRRSQYTDMEFAGHDFWLTRNGHGAGFLDGDWETGDALDKASKLYRELELYVGPNRKIYCHGIIHS
jgi:hypothetical protein